MNVRLSAALTAALASLLPAQQPAPEPVSLPAPIADWLTPIHTQPDDPEHGAYGVWAAGPDYKVSFDHGYTFYPVLGEAYPENLPLAWRTARIAVGDRVLVDATTPARPSYTDWRYELRYPTVTEAYDVLAAGVEQTFVLHQPAGAGDLVIEGSITTRLRAAMAPAGHQSLSFADTQGRELVRYGRAFAIDAGGRRLELATAFDAERVELRVPSAWLASATYPVVVDPLTSRTTIVTNGGAVVREPHVERDDAGNELMVTFTRISAGTDQDAWGRLRNDAFGHVALAFSDITDNWSTTRTSVAFVNGSTNWVIAAQRNSLASGASLIVYVHDGGNTVQNSGVTMFLSKPAGAYDQYPSLGGSASVAISGRALLVFQRDIGAFSSPATRVYAVTIDPVNASFGVQRDLHTNPSIPNYDAEWPSVSAVAANGGSWVVVWQEYNDANSNDDWDIVGQRVNASGLLLGDAVFGLGSSASRHKLFPVVAGQAGRYAVAYLMQANASKNYSPLGNQIALQRFDWSESDAAPQIFDNRILADTGAVDDLELRQGNRPLAYDTDTDSHWAVAYKSGDELLVQRCGFSGLVVESATVFSAAGRTPYNAGLCYDNDAGEFAIVFGTDEFTGPLYGVRLQHGAAANVPYGSGCAGVLSAFNRGLDNRPHAGSQFFGIQLTGGAGNAPTVLMLGVGAGNVPLPGGCTFLLDPALPVFNVPAGTSDAAGGYTRNIALVDTVSNLDLYWQVVQLSGIQIVSSDGLQTQIR